jgi:hypothetical protein
MIMDDTTFALELNDLVTRYLEDSGDHSFCAETLREIADEVIDATATLQLPQEI